MLTQRAAPPTGYNAAFTLIAKSKLNKKSSVTSVNQSTQNTLENTDTLKYRNILFRDTVSILYSTINSQI